MAPYVERLHLLGFPNVIEVNFGGAPTVSAWRAYGFSAHSGSPTMTLCQLR